MAIDMKKTLWMAVLFTAVSVLLGGFIAPLLGIVPASIGEIGIQGVTVGTILSNFVALVAALYAGDALNLI